MCYFMVVGGGRFLSARRVEHVRGYRRCLALWETPPVRLHSERERVFIDKLLVRIHSIIEMVLVDRPCAM